LTHNFLVLVTVGLGHWVYRKLYTLIESQRAEMFENHWTRDTFIKGLAPPLIYQRIFERAALSLVQAVELADSLDQSLKQAPRDVFWGFSNH